LIGFGIWNFAFPPYEVSKFVQSDSATCYPPWILAKVTRVPLRYIWECVLFLRKFSRSLDVHCRRHAAPIPQARHKYQPARRKALIHERYGKVSLTATYETIKSIFHESEIN